MGTELRIKTIGLLGLLIFLCSAKATYAQRDATEPRRVDVELDRWEDKIVLAITHDFWLDTPNGVNFRMPSLGFKAHFFSDYAFKDGIVSFAWGFGVSSDNVHSNAMFVQESFEDGTVGDQILTPFPEEYEYETSKFNTTYLEIPIEFRVITKGRSPFKFAAGFKVGYMVGNKWKIIDTEGKRKYFDFDHMNKLRYGATARLGVGKVQLTGFYSLVPLIEPGKGTEVIPVSLGLAFTFIK
jgi:hypothetical protein